MNDADRKRAASWGALGIAMVATALYARLMPNEPAGSWRVGFAVASAALFVVGLFIGLKANFIGLLSWVRTRRPQIGGAQKKTLSALYRWSWPMMVLLIAGGGLGVTSPLFDRQQAWIAYATGYVLMMIAFLCGMTARVQEVKILAEDAD